MGLRGRAAGERYRGAKKKSVIGYYAAVRYVCVSLGQGLRVLFAGSALSFARAETAPGSPVDELRLDPRISPDTSPARPQGYGLGLDLGYSVIHNGPVAPLSADHAPAEPPGRRHTRAGQHPSDRV